MKFGIKTLFALTAAIIFLVNPLVSFGIDGNILFTDNFSDGNLDGWTIESGNWFINNGNLAASKSGRAFGGRIDTGNSEWDNYRLEIDINNQQGVDEGVGFRYNQNGDSYELNLRHGTGLYNTPEIVLRKNKDNVVTVIGNTHSFPLINNKWYHLKIEAFEENLKVWIDNTLIFDILDNPPIKKGALTLSYWTGDASVVFVRFDNVKVTSLLPIPTPTPSPTPTPPPGPTPFLDLPWDYVGKGLSFNEAANSMSSYFDHEYPFLSAPALNEPSIDLVNFWNIRGRDLSYSSHDGYDYAKLAKVYIGDPVLATADGIITRGNPSSCGACGNYLLIDHGNKYQTRYYHLLNDSPIVNLGESKPVKKGEQIGKVGATGNVRPSGDAGAHIHFMVVQDKNNDGNFNDNIPDGVTDPFGWQSKDPDPWPNFNFNYLGQARTGNKSYYLWTKKLDNLDASLTSNGGVFKTERYTLDFPSGSTNQNLNLNLQSAPNISPSNILSSIGSTIIATATDTLGNLVTQFQNLFTLTIDFSQFDLSRYNPDTISIYSSQDGINWSQIPTNVDFGSNTASAQINHFTYFALMAERLDVTAPLTTANLSGHTGQNNYFSSDVVVSLNAEDNNGGLGVDYTMYKLQGEDWTVYVSPIIIESEGHHKIEFYSADKDENLEDIKSVEFDIDKTTPDILITAPTEGSVYLLNQVAQTDYSCSDSDSNINSCLGPGNTGSNLDTSSVGAKTFTVEATDIAGNTTSKTITYLVQYIATGTCLSNPTHAILQPINIDGSSIFKQGSTIPAKFRVCDNRGLSVGSSELVKSFNLVKTVSGTTTSNINESVPSTTPETTFRWDQTSQQWIFNMGTKSLSAGKTYFYKISLNDLSTIEFSFGLR